jgi:hypothetical protein
MFSKKEDCKRVAKVIGEITNGKVLRPFCCHPANIGHSLETEELSQTIIFINIR